MAQPPSVTATSPKPAPSAIAGPPAGKLEATATTPQSKASTAGQAVPTVALPFKIENVSNRVRYLNAIIYGEYGTGKTTLMGTACEVPQMADVLLVDAESGDLSLDQYDNLDVVRVTNFAQVARIHEFLVEHCRARDAGNMERLAALEQRLKGLDQPPSEPRQYRTVLMDSLTEVETYNMYNLLSVNDSTKIDADMQSAEWAEYKRNNVTVQRMIRQYRDLPMNFIVCAAAKYAQDEMKRKAFVPDLTGQLAKKVQGFMDLVGYLVVAQPQSQVDGQGETSTVIPRRLYVQPSPEGRFDAKNRFTRYTKSYFDNPTIGLILKECGLLQQR